MGSLHQFVDFLTIVLGFSAIIFLHELGHFAAARWAGVRVLAFAIGFGPAAFSYRKGMGFSAGSSEARYRKLARAQGDGRGLVPGVSPTEYRLNWLPLGGYVKMLGQDDADPAHRSAEPDSYNSVSIPKRMVIISAGVIMNLVTAAIMFVVVFFVGLKTESPRIGGVLPNSAAARATAEVAPGAAPMPVGLRAGDVITSINGSPVEAFKDITLAVAMAKKDTPLKISVDRPTATPGTPERLVFTALPTLGTGSRMLELGVGPSSSGTLDRARSAADQKIQQENIIRAGLPATVTPGMKLDADQTWSVLAPRFKTSNGVPVEAVFVDGAGQRVPVSIKPEADWQVARIARGWASPTGDERTPQLFEHLLGFVPVMSVQSTREAGEKAGLRPGDVFARIGTAEWPSLVEGMRQIKNAPGTTIDLVVMRTEPGETTPKRIELKGVPILVENKERVIGFVPGSAASVTNLGGVVVSRWPVGAQPAQEPAADKPESAAALPPAAAWSLLSGTVIEQVNNVPVLSLIDLRGAIASVIAAAPSAPTHDIAVTLRLPQPTPESPVQRETRTLTLSAADATTIQALGWSAPVAMAYLFSPDEILLKRSSVGGAIAKGFDETRKMVLTTYMTFARLFQGTVKVEHLKGPVGIAHVGTLIAERGFIWVLFFMAALSVNLAVVNFLPLPIVDGGHFLFLCYEAITGKPVSVMFQNIATIAGLALIGTMFLVVTFNDIVRLLG